MFRFQRVENKYADKSKKLLFVFGMMLHLQPENSKVLAFR